MANLSPLFNAIANTDANGQLLSLGKIYSYQSGSTTPLATYSDSAGAIANTNPIVLGTDAKILGNLWLSENLAYKFVVQTASNVQVATYDNISGVVTNTPQTQLLPTGVILIWSGSTGSIPVGWSLCDGQQGRPDLRDRFVVGAGSTYIVNATGGSKDAVVVEHRHVATSTVTDPMHFHASTNNGAYNGQGTGNAMGVGSNTPGWNTTSVATGITVATTIESAGISGVNANLVPYWALCYIIKL